MQSAQKGRKRKDSSSASEYQLISNMTPSKLKSQTQAQVTINTSPQDTYHLKKRKAGFTVVSDAMSQASTKAPKTAKNKRKTSLGVGSSE